MTTTVELTAPIRPVPTLTGLSHLGLTVRDIVASEAWYTQVLGLVRAFVEPHGTGDGYAVVMTRRGTGLFVGLDFHPDADREIFTRVAPGSTTWRSRSPAGKTSTIGSPTSMPSVSSTER